MSEVKSGMNPEENKESQINQRIEQIGEKIDELFMNPPTPVIDIGEREFLVVYASMGKIYHPDPEIYDNTRARQVHISRPKDNPANWRYELVDRGEWEAKRAIVLDKQPDGVHVIWKDILDDLGNTVNLKDIPVHQALAQGINVSQLNHISEDALEFVSREPKSSEFHFPKGISPLPVVTDSDLKH